MHAKGSERRRSGWHVPPRPYQSCSCLPPADRVKVKMRALAQGVEAWNRGVMGQEWSPFCPPFPPPLCVPARAVAPPPPPTALSGVYRGRPVSRRPAKQRGFMEGGARDVSKRRDAACTSGANEALACFARDGSIGGKITLHVRTSITRAVPCNKSGRPWSGVIRAASHASSLVASSHVASPHLLGCMHAPCRQTSCRRSCK